MIVCDVQIQNELEEASNKELAVCVDRVSSCIQSTMKSLQHAFNVPEIKAAMCEWHDKENVLERLIQKVLNSGGVVPPTDSEARAPT